jgi:hypothetical protein
MSAQRYEPELPSSVERIRRARLHLKTLPKQRRIELMVEAGALTAEDAERAKKRLAEPASDEAQAHSGAPGGESAAPPARG